MRKMRTACCIRAAITADVVSIQIASLTENKSRRLSHWFSLCIDIVHFYARYYNLSCKKVPHVCTKEPRNNTIFTNITRETPCVLLLYHISWRPRTKQCCLWVKILAESFFIRIFLDSFKPFLLEITTRVQILNILNTRFMSLIP